MLAITENGYGKQTPVEDYRITNRGGLGIKNYMVTDKTGPVVGIKVVDGTEGPVAGDPGRHPDPHPGGQHPHRGPGHSGRHRHAVQGGGDHVISLALTDHEEGAAPRPRNKAVRSQGENASAGMFIRTQGSCSRGDGSPIQNHLPKGFHDENSHHLHRRRLLRQSGPRRLGRDFDVRPHSRELSGGEAATTNNRMELTAVIQALSLLKEPCIVDLWSDSKYVIDGLEKGWAKGWKARGWKKLTRSPP